MQDAVRRPDGKDANGSPIRFPCVPIIADRPGTRAFALPGLPAGLEDPRNRVEGPSGLSHKGGFDLEAIPSRRKTIRDHSETLGVWLLENSAADGQVYRDLR